MAQRYRQYLQEERAVPRLRGPVYPLHLRFFMGVERPSFIFPEFIRLTTYDQVIAILEDLKQRGVEGSVVNAGRLGAGRLCRPVAVPAAA